MSIQMATPLDNVIGNFTQMAPAGVAAFWSGVVTHQAEDALAQEEAQEQPNDQSEQPEGKLVLAPGHMAAYCFPFPGREADYLNQFDNSRTIDEHRTHVEVTNTAFEALSWKERILRQNTIAIDVRNSLPADQFNKAHFVMYCRNLLGCSPEEAKEVARHFAYTSREDRASLLEEMQDVIINVSPDGHEELHEMLYARINKLQSIHDAILQAVDAAL